MNELVIAAAVIGGALFQSLLHALVSYIDRDRPVAECGCGRTLYAQHHYCPRCGESDPTGMYYSESADEGMEVAAERSDPSEVELKKVAMWTMVECLESGLSPYQTADYVPYSDTTVRNWMEEYDNGGEKREWVSEVERVIEGEHDQHTDDNAVSIPEEQVKRFAAWTMVECSQRGLSARETAEYVPYSHSTVNNWLKDYEDGGEKREWVRTVEDKTA